MEKSKECIIEDNKSIAEFMEYERNKMEYFIFQHGYFDFNGQWIDKFHKKDLEFHKSWDWLMPVVQKINNNLINDLSYEVTISPSETTILEKNLTVGPIIYGDDIFDNTYKAIIEFIEFYYH